MSDCGPVFPEGPSSFLCISRSRPMQSREGCDIEGQACAFSDGYHRGQAAAKGVAQFQEAVGTFAGDVSDDHAATMSGDLN